MRRAALRAALALAGCLLAGCVPSGSVLAQQICSTPMGTCPIGSGQVIQGGPCICPSQSGPVQGIAGGEPSSGAGGARYCCTPFGRMGPFGAMAPGATCSAESKAGTVVGQACY